MKFKLNTKTFFERKITTCLCRDLKKLSGQKWTMSKIRDSINSADFYCLNEIGRKYDIDRNLVKYDTASYIIVKPKQFIAQTGEQLYLWCYRKSINEKYGKINIGVYDDFDYAVVINNFTKQNS